MERLQEIATRKAELKVQLESKAEDLDLEAIEKEMNDLAEEEKSINEKIEAETRKANEEAEARRKEAEALNDGEKKAKEIEKKEEKKMTNVFATAEYRSAWAKKMMGLSADKFTEEETRALGDAITTTATTFVESDADTQGINNAGLLIPTSLREELMENIFQVSPFLQDVRKLAVSGNVDLPYLFDADDAEWYGETSCTVNEGIEFKNLKLTGFELAKDIEITWKAEEMTVPSFIGFLLEELSEKMGRALANAVLYGNGSGKPTGALNGLDAVTDADPIQAIAKAKAQLSSKNKIGAIAYISENVEDAIVFTKDEMGRYPYLAGLPRVSSLEVKVDPFLQNNDILVGNPKYYILNEVRPISIDKDKDVKCRRVVYGAYGIFDGKAKPNAFAKAQVVSASI